MKKMLCTGIFVVLLPLVIVTTLLIKLKTEKMDISVNGITINVCNWGEFISDGSDGLMNVNEEFTKKTGIKVNYTTFQNNESLFAKLKNKSIQYDVIVPSEYMAAKLIKNNMVKKLDHNKIPNINLVDDSLKKMEYDPTGEYSVPYAWGVVSIIYNKQIVTEKPENIDFNIFWNEKYKGKMLMFDNPRDAFAIAQMRRGFSLNTLNKNEWLTTIDDLKKQKNLNQAYVMDQIFDKMASEEAAIAPYYLGDALNLRKMNPNLCVTIPKNGTNKFIDVLCIPVNAAHVKEAHEYINFLCSPEVSAANMEHIQYFSPISDVNNIDEIENVPNLEKLTDPQFTQSFTDLPKNISDILKDGWLSIKLF